MPKRGRRFVTEFLLPNLRQEKFGRRLMWLDAAQGTFQIAWHHKGANAWSEEDSQVFVEWDLKQGRSELNHSLSKQRFRAVLNKLMKDGHLLELTGKNSDKNGDKNRKIFQILHPQKENAVAECNYASERTMTAIKVEVGSDDIPSRLFYGLQNVLDIEQRMDFDDDTKRHFVTDLLPHSIPFNADYHSDVDFNQTDIGRELSEIQPDCLPPDADHTLNFSRWGSFGTSGVIFQDHNYVKEEENLYSSHGLLKDSSFRLGQCFNETTDVDSTSWLDGNGYDTFVELESCCSPK